MKKTNSIEDVLEQLNFSEEEKRVFNKGLEEIKKYSSLDSLDEKKKKPETQILAMIKEMTDNEI